MNVSKPLAAVSAIAMAIGLAVVPAQAARTDIAVGMVLEPPNLDPTAGAAAAIDEVVYANIFQGLTRFNSDGEVVPDLAKSWDISEDVKFSLARARADESTNAQKALFAEIADVAVIDPQTVKVTLSEPNGSLLFNMAWGDAVIVAPETAETNAIQPVGTGPFRFDDWVKGDHVDLSKYADYCQ